MKNRQENAGASACHPPCLNYLLISKSCNVAANDVQQSSGESWREQGGNRKQGHERLGQLWIGAGLARSRPAGQGREEREHMG